MNELNKDILIGSLFITGILSFISGLFLASAVMFAITSLISNMSDKAHIKG